MPAFSYTALNPAGQQVTGKLQVGSRAEAFRRLEAQSLTPVKVAEEALDKAAMAKAAAIAEQSKVPPVLKRAQLILFTEELADLLDGGLQIDQALRILEERQEAPNVKRVAAALRVEVREGSTISRALKKVSPSFDDLYLNMVSAGEASGSLPEILKRLGQGLTVIAEMQSKVVQALIYPAFLVLASIGMILVFMLKVLPEITKLITATGSKLPPIAQMMIKVSEFLGQWWWALLAATIAGALTFRGYIATPKGRYWWDGAKLKLPLFGPVLATRIYAQFSHSLGNLVINGVPLLNGLKLATRATSNVVVRTLLLRASALVGEGAPLSASLRKVQVFPQLLSDMIAVGEQTGHLGRSLSKCAARYDKELDLRIKRLTSLISPIIMLIMAVVVGVVAYAIVTAVFSASSGVRNSA
jgi:type II secretory pathway component PulF